MTNQEALNYFNEELKDGKCSDTCPMCNAMEAAIQTLEKQIPKKPKQAINNAYCPYCKEALGKSFAEKALQQPHWYKHCFMCGQALDWSDENDTR